MGHKKIYNNIESFSYQKVVNLLFLSELHWKKQNGKMISNNPFYVFVYDLHKKELKIYGSSGNLYNNYYKNDLKFTLNDTNNSLFRIINLNYLSFPYYSKLPIKVRVISQKEYKHICKGDRTDLFKYSVDIPYLYINDLKYCNCNLYVCSKCRRIFIYNDERIKLQSIHQKSLLFHEQNNSNEFHFVSKESNSKNVITIADFLVRTSSAQCVNRSHNIQSIKAIVNVLTDSQIIERTISAYYCMACDKYYIGESTYQTLKKEGTICCKVVELEDLNNNLLTISGWQKKSLLKMYGYNVEKNNGLSSIQRRKILLFIIENKIMSKYKIINLLEGQIMLHKKQESMKEAVEKWSEDIDFVQKYNITDESVKVRAIFVKKRKL